MSFKLLIFLRLFCALFIENFHVGFNLLTASDFTMYPFSTQNAKDFENLLSVYLDAAFFPHLREQDFRLVC